MKADVLNLYQLKVFQLVAQKKLIREVANELQVTASAVSQSLAKLEQDLGTELFVHDVRPLRLTPAGQALLKGAPALLESADLLRRSVTDHSLADISLRLGMSESVTSTISPWLISSLKRCVRELDCVSFLTKPLVEHLRNDQINVAVLPEALLSEDRWERNALYEEDFLLVHAKNGPDFSEGNFAAAAAVSPYIGYSRTGSSDQLEIGRILRSLDIRPNQTVEVASSYALVGLVSELNGWAIVPPTNIWCGRQFAHNLVISPLPGSKRIARTMWALCDRNLYGGRTQLVGEIVKHIFSEKMVPELGAINPLLAKHVRLL